MISAARFESGACDSVRHSRTYCRRAGARSGLISLEAGFDSRVCNSDVVCSLRERSV